MTARTVEAGRRHSQVVRASLEILLEILSRAQYTPVCSTGDRLSGPFIGPAQARVVGKSSRTVLDLLNSSYTVRSCNVVRHDQSFDHLGEAVSMVVRSGQFRGTVWRYCSQLMSGVCPLLLRSILPEALNHGHVSSVKGINCTRPCILGNPASGLPLAFGSSRLLLSIATKYVERYPLEDILTV